MTLRWLNNFIGIPFDEKGYSFDGCHCWGLVCLFYESRKQIVLPRYENLYNDANDCDSISSIINNEKSNWKKLNPGDEVEGDLVLMRMKGLPIHIGIVIGDGEMLHTMQGIKSAIENYQSPKYINRTLGFYRYAGE